MKGGGADGGPASMKDRTSRAFKGKHLEVRVVPSSPAEEEGRLDEVVGQGRFDLKQMDDRTWWLGLYTKSGDLRVVLWAERANMYGAAQAQ